MYNLKSRSLDIETPKPKRRNIIMTTATTSDSKVKILETKFKLDEKGTNVRTETLAGLTTFLTCVYILAVNPAILSSTGMDPKAVFWATAISSGFASILMGVLTNFPFALAPAMGLNAYFAYYVVGTLGLSWQNALACVFVSGLTFTILSLLKVSQKIVDAIPSVIRNSVGPGIGLFIAFTGLSQAGIVVSSPDTIVQLGDLSNPGVILAIIGIALTAFLVIKGIKGGMLIGILAVTILGLFVTNPTTGLTYTQWPTAGLVSLENPITALAPTFGQLSFQGMFNGPLVVILGILFAVFSFLFVDLFDSIGVLLGVSAKAGFFNEKGELPNAGKALFVSSFGAMVGSLLGTNTVTVYGAESSTGIAEGGKTGLTAITVGVLFFIALILSPLFLMIPSIATAPALIMVGVFMLEPLNNIKLSNLTTAFPAFLTVAIMPFTSSIDKGILFGILGFTLAMIASKRTKEVSKTMWILTIILFGYLLLEILIQ